MYAFAIRAVAEHERIPNKILHYRLDNSSGVAFDSSQNRDHGTVVGATRGVSGKINDCFTFDGVNDEITNAPTNAINAIKNSAVFSVCLWAKSAAYNTADSAIAIRNGTTNNVLQMYPYWDNTIGLRFYWNGSYYNTNSVQSLNTWHHFAFVSVNTTRHEIYVDGTYLGFFGNNDKLSNGTNNINVGSWYTGQEHYAGELDDIRIYDRALSAAEVAVLANMSTGFES